jgi:hypothetical protein
MIMPYKGRILEEQRRVFRIATDPQRYGLTCKAIAIDACVDEKSLRNYAKGETEMPLSVLYRLCGVIPNELLSLLLPGEFVITQQLEDIDHNEFAAKAIDYLATKAAAHRPQSECGEKLGPNETADLDGRVVQMRGVA